MTFLSCPSPTRPVPVTSGLGGVPLGTRALGPTPPPRCCVALAGGGPSGATPGGGPGGGGFIGRPLTGSLGHPDLDLVVVKGWGGGPRPAGGGLGTAKGGMASTCPSGCKSASVTAHGSGIGAGVVYHAVDCQEDVSRTVCCPQSDLAQGSGLPSSQDASFPDEESHLSAGGW